MAAVLANRCRFCQGPIVRPEGVAASTCDVCDDAPRRIALRALAFDRFCADVHDGFAVMARKRGDVEMTEARERRAAELRR